MPAKFKLILPVICIVIAAVIITAGIVTDRGENYSTVVWYTPHPDDETLFMGGAIHKAGQSGKENVLVLLTKGGSSAVIDKINEQLPAEYAKLTREQFMQARVNEFLLAADRLGLGRENIIILDYADGALNEEDAYRVILDLAKRYPEASHRTISWYDDHPDHIALGKALLRAYQEGIIADARFFLKSDFTDATGKKLNFLYGEHLPVKRKALEAYGIWDPDGGWYGIGQISVYEYFEQAHRSRFEFYHFPE